MSADDFIKDNSEPARYSSGHPDATKIGMQICNLVDAIESLHPKDYMSLIGLFSETDHYFDDVEYLLMAIAKIYVSVLMNPNIKVQKNEGIDVEHLMKALINV